MKRVLITPLDWGLGHATRCVPLIVEFQRQGCEVFLAGSGDAIDVLNREFPGFKSFELPGYEPNYPGGGSMVWSMARQFPRFTAVIASEHEAVEEIVAELGIELVVSDNRYGCWSEDIPSILITHQVNILMPRMFRWLGSAVRGMTAQMINRFDACWIPDVPGENSLAGMLASTDRTDIKVEVRHVGWLSRFQNNDRTPAETFDVLALLSGPEPQRTALENILIPQLMESGLNFRVVRGLPLDERTTHDHRIVNYMEAELLRECIQSASLVIARSGYSTMMDLQALGKKAVFVPTPGQTEQEYLAKHMMEKGIAFSMPQSKFSLDLALTESVRFRGFERSEKNHLLSDAVSEVLTLDQTQGT